MLKLHPNTAGEALPQALPRGPRSGLHGEPLAAVSVEEGGKWPLARRLRLIVLLAALA